MALFSFFFLCSFLCSVLLLFLLLSTIRLRMSFAMHDAVEYTEKISTLLPPFASFSSFCYAVVSLLVLVSHFPPHYSSASPGMMLFENAGKIDWTSVKESLPVFLMAIFIRKHAHACTSLYCTSSVPLSDFSELPNTELATTELTK